MLLNFVLFLEIYCFTNVSWLKAVPLFLRDCADYFSFVYPEWFLCIFTCVKMLQWEVTNQEYYQDGTSLDCHV